jgi:hypothetical protein
MPSEREKDIKQKQRRSLSRLYLDWIQEWSVTVPVEVGKWEIEGIPKP